MKPFLKVFIVIALLVGFMIPTTANAGEICGFNYCIADEVSPECKATLLDLIAYNSDSIRVVPRSIHFLNLLELLPLRASLISHGHGLSQKSADIIIYNTIVQATNFRKISEKDSHMYNKYINRALDSIREHPLKINQQQMEKLNTIFDEFKDGKLWEYN